MNMDAISAANPYSGLANTQHVNTENINALNPINAPQPVAQPTSLRPSEIVANSEAHISNPGQLINADDTLQMAAFALLLPKAFTTQTVTSSAPSIATASARNVPPGNYVVQVTQLAQAQTLISNTQVSPYSPIGSGSATLNFAFASGITRSIPIGSNDNNLAAISLDINRAHLGISARVLTTSAGAKLQLTGQTGEVNSFSVSASGNAALSQLFSTAAGGGLTQTTAAQDALGSVNGIAFSSSTNTIFTATSGLALNLNAVGSTTLNVAPSNVNISGVEAFINALNHFRTALQQFEQNGPGVEQSQASFQTALDRVLTQSQPALAGIGVTFNPNGTLSLDTAVFQAALTGNPAAVAQVFSNNGFGVAERILTLIESTMSLSPLNLLQTTASDGHREIQHEYDRQQEHSQNSGRASLNNLV